MCDVLYAQYLVLSLGLLVDGPNRESEIVGKLIWLLLWESTSYCGIEEEKEVVEVGPKRSSMLLLLFVRPFSGEYVAVTAGWVTALFSLENPLTGFRGENTGGNSIACRRYVSCTCNCTNHTPPAGLPGSGVREYHSLNGLVWCVVVCCGVL